MVCDCAKHRFQIQHSAWLEEYRQMFATCKDLMNPALQMAQDLAKEKVEASWRGYMNSECTSLKIPTTPPGAFNRPALLPYDPDNQAPAPGAPDMRIPRTPDIRL